MKPCREYRRRLAWLALDQTPQQPRPIHDLASREGDPRPQPARSPDARTERLPQSACAAGDWEEVAALRQHLNHCGACRVYFAEISQCSQSLAASAEFAQTGVRASEDFHRRVLEALRPQQPHVAARAWSRVLGTLRPLNPKRKPTPLSFPNGRRELSWLGDGSWSTLLGRLGPQRVRWSLALPLLVTTVVVVTVFVTGWPSRTGPARHAREPTMAAVSRPHKDLAPSFSNYLLVATRSLDRFDDLLTRQAERNLPSAPVFRASTLSSAEP